MRKRVSNRLSRKRNTYGVFLYIADILEAMRIQKEAGLLTNDALLLAVARRLNCEAVASADKAIAQAPSFRVFCPADVEASMKFMEKLGTVETRKK
jgi:predicted nucleic acid-binding protein